MSRLDALKRKLSEREAVLSTTVSCVAWSGLIQKLAASPLDFVVLDLEHGILSTEGIEEQLRVARLCDLPTVVRVGDAVPHLISKVVDMGADGVMIPRVETPEQVETAVRALRFAPMGRKGCGGFSLLRTGEKLEQVNGNRMLLIQIESDEGIESLDTILDRFGDTISGVIVGPYDMSILTGTPLDTKCPAMLERIGRVFGISASRGVSCGIFVDGEQDLGHWRSLGANILWTGSELGLMGQALSGLCGAFARLKGE